MKKRNLVVSMALALILFPEPATTAVGTLLLCGWYFLRRRRNGSVKQDPTLVSKQSGTEKDWKESPGAAMVSSCDSAAS